MNLNPQCVFSHRIGMDARKNGLLAKYASSPFYIKHRPAPCNARQTLLNYFTVNR
jgi:hypothetical protein